MTGQRANLSAASRVTCCSMLLLASLAGCASSANTAGDGAAAASQTRGGAGGVDVRGMLLNDENGVEVRQVVIADEVDAIAEAMAPWVERQETAEKRPAVNAATAERLRRNGFRLVAVPVDELDALMSALGGASMDVSSWQGQMYKWRDLHSLPIGPGGRTMAVDGRVRRYQGGDMRLMARGWVVQMEYGPRVQLELVPQHWRSESTYHRLLGQNSTDASALPSLALHMLLEPGYAYILTCECPQVQWSAAVTDDDNGAAEDGDARDDDDAAASRRRGRTASMGPDVQGPTTVGQVMLSSGTGRPSRGMLIFTPRIASQLFPPGEQVPVTTEARATAGRELRR